MTATGEIPTGWIRTTLGKLVQVLRGVTYEKSASRGKREPGFIPILRATNIGQHLDFDDLVFVPESCVSKEQRLRLGDIVVAASSGSRSVVGKAAPLSIAWTGSFGAFCVAVRPSELVNPRYIALFFATGEYRERASILAAGVNINNLKREHILSTPFNLAPRNEQDRIVTELDKQFTRLDASVEALKRVQVQLKRYRASILKTACEGRLVPTEAELARREKRDYEPADKLLARILNERRARWEADQLAKMKSAGRPPRDHKWKAKYSEPAVPKTAGLPTLPDGWCWVTVDAVAFVTKLAGFEYTKCVKYDPLGDLAVIKAENAQRNGFKRTDFSRVHSATVSALTRSQLQAGDVLMVFVGAGTGNVARVPADQPYFLGPNIGMIRPTTSMVRSAYLELYLRSPLGHRLALNFAKAVAQPSLSMGAIRQIQLAIPPLNEQERIVAEAERCLSFADALHESVQANLSRAANLRSSILRSAFSGLLVAQNSADESATALLARIGFDKESTPSLRGTVLQNSVKKP